MDVRHGLRVLRGRPVLTAAAVGSLALGVGVGTALFSVADALSLRPLEVARPGELVEFSRARERAREPLSWPEVASSRRRRRPSRRSPRSTAARHLRRGDGRELLLLTAVSADYFEALGVSAALGRVIGAGADQGLPSSAS